MSVYQKINKVLKQHENHKYCERSLDSIADYINWAWKWKKITREEMISLADRVCALYDVELEKTIDRSYDGYED